MYLRIPRDMAFLRLSLGDGEWARCLPVCLQLHIVSFLRPHPTSTSTSSTIRSSPQCHPSPCATVVFFSASSHDVSISGRAT